MLPDPSVGRRDCVPAYVTENLPAFPDTNADAFFDSTTGLLGGTCKCNRTHRVEYAYAMPNETGRADTIYVYEASHQWPSTEEIELVDARRAPAVLWYAEPPAHLPYSWAPGFDALIGFRRPAAGEYGVWYPEHTRARIQEAVRYWASPDRFQPHARTNIGVWVANCMPTIYRTSAIDALLRAGLPVVSFGRCRRHGVPPTLWRLRVADPEASVNASDGSAGPCRRHRLMLAIENNACEDYVTRSLFQALAVCGAIPIVKAPRGVPDYVGLFGRFPYVNASRPGWLDEVRRILTDDAYYRRLLVTAAAATADGADDGSKAEAQPPNFHCQWWALHAALGHRDGSTAMSSGNMGAHTTPRAVPPWAQCLCPRVHASTDRADYDEMCATPGAENTSAAIKEQLHETAALGRSYRHNHVPHVGEWHGALLAKRGSGVLRGVRRK